MKLLWERELFLKQTAALNKALWKVLFLWKIEERSNKQMLPILSQKKKKKKFPIVNNSISSYK